MIGLYIRYESGLSRVTQKLRISCFYFDNQPRVNAHNRDCGEGKISRLKCICGSDDWTDNGRFMHEYECAGCGQYVEAYPFTNSKMD